MQLLYIMRRRQLHRSHPTTPSLLSACPQMGACCSSPSEKYDYDDQVPATSGSSHKNKRPHSNTASSAAKSKTPDFGFGDAFEVCASHAALEHARSVCDCARRGALSCSVLCTPDKGVLSICMLVTTDAPVKAVYTHMTTSMPDICTFNNPCSLNLLCADVA